MEDFTQLLHQQNKVIALHPDLKTFIYGDEGFSSSYSMRLVEGGAMGDIYGKAFKRDENGRIVYTKDEDGDQIPVVIGSGNTEKVGNSNPNFMLGWGNAFTYKGFSLYFLIDGRFGGDVLSQTQADMDQKGSALHRAKHATRATSTSKARTSTLPSSIPS